MLCVILVESVHVEAVCNMRKPDGRRPKDIGIFIRQILIAHVASDIYH